MVNYMTEEVSKETPALAEGQAAETGTAPAPGGNKKKIIILIIIAVIFIIIAVLGYIFFIKKPSK